MGLLYMAIALGLIGAIALLMAINYSPHVEWAQFASAGTTLSICHHGKGGAEFRAFLDKMVAAVNEARDHKGGSQTGS